MEMGRPIVAILRMQNSDLTISNNMLWPRIAQIARQHLFAHQNMENIPPSEAAPLQNVLRAVYQAGYLWGLNTRIKSPVFPSANDWGWLGDGSSAHPYVLNWTMLPQASKVCKEYPHCKCKKGCRRNCQCFNNTLRCTKVWMAIKC